MNMRKIIAVLSAVLMLCAIIPMGAISVSAVDAILDSNFDDGTTGSWKWATDDTVVVEDGAMKWTTLSWKNTYHNFTATAGKDYKLTFKMKSADALTVDVKFLAGSWADSGITKYVASNTADQAGTWVEHTYIFNSGSYGGLVLLLQSHKATDIYMDDFLIEEYVVPVDPVFPENAIYVETFETATANGWSTSTSSIVETADLASLNAEGGNYAMQFTSTYYSYTNYQLTVEPNTDYKVTYSILSGTNGYPINARIRGNNEDLGLLYSTPSTTAWTTHTYTFNSGDYTSVGLRFQAGWETGTYYIDNISVAPFDAGTMTDDGHVVNGDWETGDTANWVPTANAEVVADPTGAGQGYVIHTQETANVNMFSQEFKNLVVGKEYTLSFKVYGYSTATNSAFWVRLPKTFTTWTQNSPLGHAKVNDYTARYNVNSLTGAWHDVQLTFTAQATTALIQFMNYRSGQGFYYFDDITLSHAYDDATCTAPKTCACGATEGEALGHTAGAAADCENAQTCTVCGEVLNAALGHSWTDATCTAPKTCSVCGATEGEALGHTYVGVETQAPTCTEPGIMTYSCACGEGTYTEEIPAAHTYTDNCDADCDVCGEWRDAPHNLTTHVEAVVPANCQEEGCSEYWICEDCNGCFQDNGWGGYSEVNPAWLYYTGEHVRPEGAAACAVVPCELCGEDSYGEPCTRPEDVPVCQDCTCVNCGETIWGWGCNYNTGDEEIPLPLCQAGTCVYCGTEYEYLYECENGAWAPCQDGECSYGCGKQYPATANHTLEDCTVDGNCSVCWSYIPAGEHTYGHDLDVDCDVCGAIREVELPIAAAGTSASEDVSGVAALFSAEVEGLAVVDGTKYEADYTDATVGGYKLIGMGAIASNSKSELDIPCVYLWDLADASYAIRVINIPASSYDVEITFTPYVIVEIDGEATTIYGEAQVASYNDVLG